MRRKRIGTITPSSNTTVEPLTTRLLASLYDLVTVHVTRIRVTEISLERSSLDQFSEETMLDAARLLADAHVDVIAWNGTSGSWRGVGGDRTLGCLPAPGCLAVGSRPRISVLDSLAATAWRTLRLVGIGRRVAGVGRLLESE